MNNSLQVFDYNGFAVRTVEKDNEVWFVAKDVCDVLDYKNVTQTLNDHLDDDERSIVSIGRQGDTNIINESGVFALILRSNKPEAKKFRKWVTGTVLPQIKRTGSFTPKPNKLTRSIMSAAKMILSAAGIKDNQLALALDKVAGHYTGESMLALSGVVLEAPSKKQLLTPSEIGQVFKLSGKRINEILMNEGFQEKVAGLWQPLQDGLPYAVMLDTNKRHSNGVPIRQLKWDSSILDVLQELLHE